MSIYNRHMFLSNKLSGNQEYLQLTLLAGPLESCDFSFASVVWSFVGNQRLGIQEFI